MPIKIHSKRSPVVAAVKEEDDAMGWFWNNRRGGGGAPLKDASGKVVTNLRLASKGLVTMEYSPTQTLSKEEVSPLFKSGGYEDENLNTPHYVGHSQDVKHKKTYSPPMSHNQQMNDDIPRTPTLSTSYQYSTPVQNRSRQPPSQTSGRASSNQSQYRTPVSIKTPRNQNNKFMSTLREMNTSVSEQERADRQQKEREYQAALRAQIEEAKRRKAIEYAQLGLPNPDDRLRARINQRRRSSGSSVTSINARKMTGQMSRSTIITPRSFSGHSRQSHQPSPTQVSVYSSSTIRPSINVENAINSTEEQYVTMPVHEYVQLSSICQQLQDQQQSLQAEIESQAKALQSLMKTKSASPQAIGLKINSKSKSIPVAKNTNASINTTGTAARVDSVTAATHRTTRKSSTVAGRGSFGSSTTGRQLTNLPTRASAANVTTTALTRKSNLGSTNSVNMTSPGMAVVNSTSTRSAGGKASQVRGGPVIATHAMEQATGAVSRAPVNLRSNVDGRSSVDYRGNDDIELVGESQYIGINESSY